MYSYMFIHAPIGYSWPHTQSDPRSSQQMGMLFIKWNATFKFKFFACVY